VAGNPVGQCLSFASACPVLGVDAGDDIDDEVAANLCGWQPCWSVLVLGQVSGCPVLGVGAGDGVGDV